MFCDVDVLNNDVNGYFLPQLWSYRRSRRFPPRMHSRWVGGFAHNMVFWSNKTGVNFPSICDIKIALPTTNNLPQWLKCFCTMVSQYPSQNSFTKMIYGCPQLLFVFFDPTKVSSSSNSPTSGISFSGGASGSC